MDGVKVWEFLWGMDLRAAVIIDHPTFNPLGPYRQYGDVMFWPCNHLFDRGLAWMGSEGISTS